MRKTQEQLEDHAAEIKAKSIKKENQMKEKEEEGKNFIEESMCFNEYYDCYNNLIAE